MDLSVIAFLKDTVGTYRTVGTIISWVGGGGGGVEIVGLKTMNQLRCFIP
jgi:hypothetical protein